MRPDPEVVEYIEQFPPEYREILYRLRELIREVVPVVEESIKWNMPTFTYIKQNICYIAGFKNHVSLNFFDGKMLSDPDNLLNGTGKHMKYIKFRSIDEIDTELIKLWLIQGFYT